MELVHRRVVLFDRSCCLSYFSQAFTKSIAVLYPVNFCRLFCHCRNKSSSNIRTRRMGCLCEAGHHNAIRQHHVRSAWRILQLPRAVETQENIVHNWAELLCGHHFILRCVWLYRILKIYLAADTKHRRFAYPSIFGKHENRQGNYLQRGDFHQRYFLLNVSVMFYAISNHTCKTFFFLACELNRLYRCSLPGNNFWRRVPPEQVN